MTRQLFAIVLAAAAFCGAARAELIVNGSFEDGAFAPANGYAMVIEPGSTLMNGWEAFNASFAWIGPGDPWGIDASSGNLFLDLTGWRTGAPYGGVRQAIATIPGRQYRLSLALGSSNTWGRPSAVTVSAGATVQTFTSPLTGSTNDWQANEMTFIATEAQTTISIVGSAGINYIGLDDVSVEDVSGGVGLQSLTLKSHEVAGCKSVSGTVTLSAPAPAGGVVVTLADTLAAATTPATVKLLEGATYKSFTVTTVAVGARQTGTVSAALGSTTLSQPLALRPMGMLSVTLVPTTVAGTQAVAGTAKLECKAGPGPVTVNLASSQPAVAQPVAPAVVVSQGLQSASFDVATSKVLVKATASISGTANGITKSKTLTVTPAATVSPTVLNFGSVTVGSTSAPLSASLTNKGAIAVAIDSIAVTGTYASWFPMTENCPASLAPGASCSVMVRFEPLSAVSRSAKVSIASSATATPLSVTVKGTGVQ